ncbi:ferrous iron transport protein B [Fournierella sp.]|uniref:ferrous iron transport protein B n=1 Tax=Allofournierella sp. TaxID=1940256 RepID=UPI0025C2E6B8|nr:ferrous iron transport protein B [Fournierella sp.]
MAITIALAGNPNCGKTTMFNALTGANQYVGNWPGVTVEKKTGKLKTGKKGEMVDVTDLPGVYSLSPYTLEEVVTRDYILNDRPDVIIDLVDATNIERNLYLTGQLIETGIPVVVALNMSDLVKKNGIHIDVADLSLRLGCPIVETSALKGTGLKEVVAEAVKLAKSRQVKRPGAIFEKAIEEKISEVCANLPAGVPDQEQRWYAIKLLEQDAKVLEQLHLDADNAYKPLSDAIAKEYDDDVEAVITDQRYRHIQGLVHATVKKPAGQMSLSDRIDRVVTNRVLGLPIFLVIMWAVYFVSVSTVGTWVTDWTNDTFVGGIQGMVGDLLTNAGVSDVLISLVVDGIIGGVGAVLGFAPQMAILFLFLSILEDCGYMVRIAFVMDRIFRHFGLSGKSFIPLMISSGCGVPGIMASKTIEQDNDRRLTIMTTTFVPCGAKLPVIALLSAVMAGQATGNKLLAANLGPVMYVIGIGAVLVSAIMLKKTKPFSGKPAPFVMELPAYHMPSAKTVLMQQPVASSISGFTAKEAIVTTMGVLANVSEDLVEDTGAVAAAVGTWFPCAAAGFSFLVFNLLNSPCLAAIATMAKEMQDRKWFWFAILYQNIFAYAVALIVYQLGGLAAGQVAVNPWTFIALAVLAVILFLLFRPDPYKANRVYARRSVEAAA